MASSDAAGVGSPRSARIVAAVAARTITVGVGTGRGRSARRSSPGPTPSRRSRPPRCTRYRPAGWPASPSPMAVARSKPSRAIRIASRGSSPSSQPRQVVARAKLGVQGASLLRSGDRVAEIGEARRVVRASVARCLVSRGRPSRSWSRRGVGRGKGAVGPRQRLGIVAHQQARAGQLRRQLEPDGIDAPSLATVRIARSSSPSAASLRCADSSTLASRARVHAAAPRSRAVNWMRDELAQPLLRDLETAGGPSRVAVSASTAVVRPFPRSAAAPARGGRTPDRARAPPSPVAPPSGVRPRPVARVAAAPVDPR